MEIGEGTTSISDTPEGVNGVRESAKCHAPSGRRIAMRMSCPGVCAAPSCQQKIKNKITIHLQNRGTLPPICAPTAPKGVIWAAGWSWCITVPCGSSVSPLTSRLFTRRVMYTMKVIRKAATIPRTMITAKSLGSVLGATSASSEVAVALVAEEDAVVETAGYGDIRYLVLNFSSVP